MKGIVDMRDADVAPTYRGVPDAAKPTGSNGASKVLPPSAQPGLHDVAGAPKKPRNEIQVLSLIHCGCRVSSMDA